MADVLNQSEIEALLAAVDSGQVHEEEPRPRVFSRRTRDGLSPDIKLYDFKRPERVSKEQMRSLQTLHEAFARNFGASLSGFLRTIVEVKVATCEQMTYSEFTSGLPNPTSFNLLSAKGLEGQLCLEISPLIIYPIIDRLLGGNSQETFIPQRPLTLIETRLISNVTKRGLAALSEAWASIREVEFEIAATESNPQLVQIVPPNEVVVVVGFELKMSNKAGTMNLCLPFNVIEPVMDRLSNQTWFAANKAQRTKDAERQMAGGISMAPLSVSGLLAETTITMSDLLHLSVGDLIVTEKPASQPVVLCVEGQKKYYAHLGQHRGQKAVRVLRPVERADRA